MMGIDLRSAAGALVCASLAAAAVGASSATADPSPTPVLPLAAAASCQVNGEYGPDSEWSLIVKKRTNITCTGAKAVIKSCAKKKTVPGWKVSTGATITFRKTNGSRKFTAMGAGGSPKCVAAAYGY